jgi:hypothetical protein
MMGSTRRIFARVNVGIGDVNVLNNARIGVAAQVGARTAKQASPYARSARATSGSSACTSTRRGPTQAAATRPLRCARPTLARSGRARRAPARPNPPGFSARSREGSRYALTRSGLSTPRHRHSRHMPLGGRRHPFVAGRAAGRTAMGVRMRARGSAGPASFRPALALSEPPNTPVRRRRWEGGRPEAGWTNRPQPILDVGQERRPETASIVPELAFRGRVRRSSSRCEASWRLHADPPAARNI